jgi:hypothetical protein
MRRALIAAAALLALAACGRATQPPSRPAAVAGPPVSAPAPAAPDATTNEAPPLIPTPVPGVPPPQAQTPAKPPFVYQPGATIPALPAPSLASPYQGPITGYGPGGMGYPPGARPNPPYFFGGAPR